MAVQIETYYDFRSPYAYFADYRVRKENLGFGEGVEWIGRPIFIDVILNLQFGREPWATFVDTLIPPKRAYLMTDIRRMAEFYGAPYKPSWKWPARPNQIPALCIASLLSGKTERAFRSIIFDALWHEQRDIADAAVLRDALARAGGDPTILDRAHDPTVHDALTARTAEAYAKGVFGTPTFVWNDEIFFGADRLEVLAWKIGRPPPAG
ncbi:MAG TPA: DsbA family protein [Beijerinckiaceae bacterium]|jgi:2-hydroxychromene-2-carboxylate isomerase